MIRAINRLYWRLFKRPRPTAKLREIQRRKEQLRYSKKAYYRLLKSARHADMKKEMNNG